MVKRIILVLVLAIVIATVTLASPVCQHSLGQHNQSPFNDIKPTTVDGDLIVSGKISSNGISSTSDINAHGNVNVKKDVQVEGNIYSSNLSAKDIHAEKVTTAGNITSQGNLTLAGSIESGASITSSNDIVSYGNVISAKNMLSFGNVIATGRITTHENIYIKKINRIGEYCSTIGLIGVDKSGQILACGDDEVWHKPNARPVTTIRKTTQKGYRFPTALVVCQPHERVTGGGGACDQPSGFIWIQESMPDSNGWFVKCDGGMRNEWGTATSWAICVSG